MPSDPMNRGTENDMILTEGDLCAVTPGQSGFIAPDGTKSPHYQDQLSTPTSAAGARTEKSA